LRSQVNEMKEEISNSKTGGILVVDDEEQILRMLGRILAREGYAFTLAADGVEARKCLEKQAFDLVLCDVNMPGESGIDLSRHIATRYADTAIIHITGVDDPNVVDSAIEAGIYGYIIKPFNHNSEIVITLFPPDRKTEETCNERNAQTTHHHGGG